MSSKVSAVCNCSPPPKLTAPTPLQISFSSSSVLMSSIRAPGGPEGPRFVHGEHQIGHAAAPWHFLYFFPLPHGHGSFLPTLGSSRRTVFTAASSPPTRAGAGADRPAGV